MNFSLSKLGKRNRSFKAKNSQVLIPFLILPLILVSYYTAVAQQKDMMIRISEIEVDTAYLEEYKVILKEEAAASVKLERGVIAIFPMYQKEHPAQVRILEIYANRIAYEQHLKTPHFLKYKTSTLKMVKSLKLVDMAAMDVAKMDLIFKKLKNK